jgi:hypothetical protein
MCGRKTREGVREVMYVGCKFESDLFTSGLTYLWVIPQTPTSISTLRSHHHPFKKNASVTTLMQRVSALHNLESLSNELQFFCHPEL